MPIVTFVIAWSVLFCAFCFATGASDHREVVKLRLSAHSLISSQYLEAAAKVADRVYDFGKYRYVDVKEHRCAALAELLGIDDIYLEDAVQSDPGLQSRDALALLLFGISLRNYVSATNELMSATKFTQRYKWNLNCSGLYGSRTWFEIRKDEPYELSLSNDGASIVVVGDILPGMFERLKGISDAHPSAKSVELVSRGGAIGEAMKIGRFIRSNGMNTVVTNNCDSSCTLVMISGVNRVMKPPFYSLGFHRIAQFDKTVPDDHPDYEAIRRYANDMIGSGDDFVAAWQSGSRDAFHRPSLKTLCDMHVATSVSGVCGKK